MYPVNLDRSLIETLEKSDIGDSEFLDFAASFDTVKMGRNFMGYPGWDY